MKTNDFRIWLKEVREVSAHTANLRISNCRKVEDAHGDLDLHFTRNKGASLMSILAYSTNDERENAPARHEVRIGGIIRTNTATFRQAVRRYIEFRVHQQEPTIIEPIENYL